MLELLFRGLVSGLSSPFSGRLSTKNCVSHVWSYECLHGVSETLVPSTPCTWAPLLPKTPCADAATTGTCGSLVDRNRRSAFTEESRSGDLTRRRLVVVIHYRRSSAEHHSQDCRAPLDIPVHHTSVFPQVLPHGPRRFGYLSAGSSPYACLL